MHLRPAVALVLITSGCVQVRDVAPPAAVRVFRLNAPDAPARTTSDDHGCQIAISRDGRTVVYPGGERRLMIRALASPEPRLLVDHWGARDAFFSPDGKFVAYFAGQQLFRARVDGSSAPRALVSSLPGHAKGGTWTRDGIIYSPESNAGLFLLPLDTLDPQPLSEPNEVAGELSHRWPDALPDGHGVLFTIKTKDLRDFNDASIAVLDRRTGKWRRLIEGGACARYVPTGHIVWGRAGKLHAAPFDLSSYTVDLARATVVCSDVRTQNESGAAMFAFSDDGTLVYMVGAATERRRELAWVRRDGQDASSRARRRAFFGDLVMAADGRRVAIPAAGANDAIWIFDLAQSDLRRFTTSGNCGAPAWSPDGERMWFLSDRSGELRLYTKRLGARTAEQKCEGVDFGGGLGSRLSLSADGKWLALARSGDIVLLDTAEQTVARSAIDGIDEVSEHPVFAPSGDVLAYLSRTDGSTSVFLRHANGGDERCLVARAGEDGNARFCWSSDGGRLFLLIDGTIFESTITRSPKLVAGSLRRIVDAEGAVDLCAEPDGNVFLVCKQVPDQARWEVRVVQNWFTQLREQTR